MGGRHARDQSIDRRSLAPSLPRTPVVAQMFVTVGVVLAVGAAAAAATNSVAVEGGTPTFTIANNRFILDGEHHRLISGSMHYFRIHPEVGLKVLLRPGPCECHYICADWENGGFPSWFATSKVSGGRTMRMRTHDPLYLEHVDRWWATLFAKLRRHMHENSGPILMV
ncbi:Beta-galactosidase [Chlorella vulgaris]